MSPSLLCRQLGMDQNYEEVKIPVPWGHISGKWWGSRDTQPVIAIHGWQDNAGTFDPLASMLLRQHGISTFCIDLPGHGLSSHYPKGQIYYIFWDGLAVLRRIVKHFKWENVTLMGHSLGGAISFLYAAIYPSEVKGYVSIDIAAPIVRDPLKSINVIGDSIDKFCKYEKLSSDMQPCYEYEEMLDIAMDGYKGSVTRKSCEILLKRGMKPAKDGSNRFLFSRDVRLKVASLGPMTLEQVCEFASRITCEVMNIRGNPGITFDNADYYEGVIDKITKAKKKEYHVIPGTHHLHLNNPDRLVGFIGNFLSSEILD